MANDWIPMRCDLPEDPAVAFIARATKLDADAVVGKLHRLWSWAGKHTADGRLPGVMEADVDARVRKRGFARAMADIPEDPWLLIEEGGVTITDFEVWLGSSSKARLSGVLRQRKARHERDETVTNVTPKRDLQKRREENTTPTPLPPPSGSALEPEWAAVEAVLLGFEVWKARDACLEARANACVPMAVRNLIEFWRSKQPAWDAGALFQRILNYRPGQDFTAGWPPASKAAARDEADKALADKRAREYLEKSQVRKQLEVDRARATALEEKWGSKLEELPKEEILALIDLAGARALLQQLPSSGIPGPGMLREILVGQLELQSMDPQEARA